jgi:hypothetical protein
MTKGLPIMRLADRPGFATTSGAAICFLKTGNVPRKGVYWFRKCSTPDCVNPDHRRMGNRSQMMKAAKHHHLPAVRAKISKIRSKVPDEVVQEIRQSDAPAKELAAKHGVHPTYIYKVRTNRCRIPFVANSVFEWRPA